MGTLFIMLLTSIFLMLAVSLIWCSWHWTAKAFLILATVLIGLSANLVWFLAQGHAHTAILPSQFLLAHTMTREPNPRNQDLGKIYLLIIEPSGKLSVPRLYSLPYTEQGQRDATQLQKKIQEQNGPVWVEKTKLSDDSSDDQSTIRKVLQGAGLGFGYYEDDARHGLVPMSSMPPLKP